MASRLDRSTRIRFVEQIPVSRTTEVKADSRAHPSPSETTELGEVVWEIELDPRGERTLLLEITVEHPRNRTVVGLG